MDDIETIITNKLADGQPLTPTEVERFIIDVPSRTESTIFRGDAGFRRSQEFLHLLGDPQDSHLTAHIAGTSGKGSVVTFLSGLLEAHGKNVGSYSSPHVYDLRERWQHNGQLVDRADLADALIGLIPAIKQMEETQWGRPTYFEVTTALAFLLCKIWQVDYSVIETGMGGLYDTTNTITRSDKLAIIAQLGLDHTHILGNTLAEIASQKAGILTPNGDAIVLQPDDPSAAQVIATVARERSCEVQYITPETYQNIRVTPSGTSFDYHGTHLNISDLSIGLPGTHQAKNASLALAALEFLAAHGNFNINITAVRGALKTAHLPGRFERRTVYGKTAILDGAHNPQKLAALADTLALMWPEKRFTWLMAFGKSKDAGKSFKSIAPLVDKLYLTSFFANQDMVLSSKAARPEDLKKLARAAGINNIFIEPDNVTALAKTASASTGITPFIVAGSFYLLGDLKL